MKKILPYLYFILVLAIEIVFYLDYRKGGLEDKTRIVLTLSGFLVAAGILILINLRKKKK